tara:strand:+ start:3328 stop:3456 length:129 start_codon:yes stop_codon:yes gene_type:complete
MAKKEMLMKIKSNSFHHIGVEEYRFKLVDVERKIIGVSKQCK